MDLLNQLSSETVEVARAVACVNGGQTPIQNQFTMGEGWKKLILHFNVAITIGNGSGVVSEGLQQYIRGILLKTSDAEIICNNVPARLLYRLAQIRNGGQASPVTTLAAASATYNIQVEIPFEDNLLRPSERFRTVLDTSRYSSMFLGISLGTIADLIATPGTATVATTVDVYVERFHGFLPQVMKPKNYVQYSVMPSVLTSSQAYIDLDKSADLSFKRLYALGSSASDGTPFNGTASDTVVTDFDIKATDRFLTQNILYDAQQRKNAADYNLTALVAGALYYDWVSKTKTLETAYKTGGDSLLRLQWRNNASGAGIYESCGYEGIRTLTQKK